MPAKARTKTKTVVEAKSRTKPVNKVKPGDTDNVRVVNKISPPHTSSNGDERKPRGLRMPQYAYMKAPGSAHDFQVGDTVEVYCDHEKNKERVRGWIRGIVVQVDNKMVAVQFRSNVFLTDGWMVPDRILWYPLNSEHIRSVAKKSVKREKAIPDY
jgi:ribosomal protein L19